MDNMKLSCLLVIIVGLVCNYEGHCTPLNKAATISVDEVIFQLYTRENRDSGSRVIPGDSASLQEAGFDPALPVKVMIHGYMDDIYSSLYYSNKLEFLNLQPMNIFALDWSACSKVVMYEQTVECAKQVGTFAGEFIQWLVDTTEVELGNVHVLGHSLGGQAVSFVSRVVKVGRISAMDPAGPLFTHRDTDGSLDPSDADFVDVVHTSTRVLGITKPVGHIDFYPNGGLEQPGCGGIFGHCAHTASHEFYAWTISEQNRNAYLSFKCDSVEQAQNQTCSGTPMIAMGYGAAPGAEGIYYVNITEVPNYDRKENVIEK